MGFMLVCEVLRPLFKEPIESEHLNLSRGTLSDSAETDD